MFAILGGGFGLYGYLPAVLHYSSDNVLIPERYRATISNRSELARYMPRIHWTADEDQALCLADAVVLARRPIDQEVLLGHLISHRNIRRIVLEKPLARDPIGSGTLLDMLRGSEASFRIAYVFPHLRWAENLSFVARQVTNTSLLLRWHFCPHHRAHSLDTWKARHSEGGGALRFYGIHVLALLARLGYDTVRVSAITFDGADSAVKWDASVEGANLVPCSVSVDCGIRDSSFAMSVAHKQGEQTVIAGSTPFERENVHWLRSEEDARVPALFRVLQSFEASHDDNVAWYSATNALWMQAENPT